MLLKLNHHFQLPTFVKPRPHFSLPPPYLFTAPIIKISHLAEKESGVSSVLENALHYVTEKDELSFSVDITMTEPVLFYEKLVEDLGLRPVNAARVPKKRWPVIYCVVF